MIPFLWSCQFLFYRRYVLLHAQTISGVTIYSLDEMQKIVRREVDMSKESWLGFWSEQKIFTRVASLHCIVVISWE
jgi:hypothetical protein